MLLRAVLKARKVTGESFKRLGNLERGRDLGQKDRLERFGDYDLRRTCAKLYRKNGCDLERSNFCSVIPPSRRQNGILGRSRVSRWL